MEANMQLLRKYANSTNICEHLDDGQLRSIAMDVISEADDDAQTQQEWFENYEEALNIAKQVIEHKSYPWRNAANIKIPLILQGCIQFNARTLPEVIKGRKTVKVDVAIPDPTGQLEQVAERLSEHMSLQTLQISENWKADTDKLLMMLPLVGTMYRKWVYDPVDKQPQSFLCMPEEIIINNATPTLSKASRITHVIKTTRNELKEMMNAGVYREVNLDMIDDEGETDTENANSYDYDDVELPSQKESGDGYIVKYEQHRWLDLDGDGYSEPYIVTVIKDTEEVVNIIARYTEDDFVMNDAGTKLVKIQAEEYFAAYKFMPSFDESFMGMGFGQLLLHLNKAANTVMNNLLDSASLSNLPSGFISESLRVRKRDMHFEPGEFKLVNSTMGQNLQNSIVTLPIKEPSMVLYQLLNLLVEQAQQVSSVSTVMQGKLPPANTPATTVLAMVQQGSKMFSAVMDRIYESLRKEFKILYRINKQYFPKYNTAQNAVKTGMVSHQDYLVDGYGVFPVADPSISTDEARMAQVQALLQLSNNPMINQKNVLERYFEAIKLPNPEKLFNPPPQGPQPEEIAMQAEAEKTQSEAMLNKVKAGIELANLELDAAEKLGLGQQRLEMDAAWRGSQVATNKISSMVELSEAENLLPPTEIEQAAQQVEAVSQESEPQINQMQMQINNLSNTINALQQQLFGVPSSQQPMPQQADQQAPADVSQAGAPAAPQEAQEPELPPEIANKLQQLAQEEQQQK